MSSILVTGGAGFIGSHVCEALAHHGYAVRVLDNFSSGRMENLESIRKKIEIVKGDITDPAAVGRAMAGVESVVHLAALVSVPESIRDPGRCHIINVQGTRNIVDAARAAGAKKIVLASSSAVYGDLPPPLREDAPCQPLSPYGQSKLEAEKIGLGAFGLKSVCLRFFNVFGPRQVSGSPYSGVISKFTEALENGQRPVIYGDGLQTRDFIYVLDVVQAILLALERERGEAKKAGIGKAGNEENGIAGRSGESAGRSAGKNSRGGIFNVGTGKPTSILELLGLLQKISHTSLNPVFHPARPGDIHHSYADIGKIKKVLGFRPKYGLEEGLKEMLDAP